MTTIQPGPTHTLVTLPPLRIRIDQRDKLDQLASARETHRAILVREAIDQYLAKQK